MKVVVVEKLETMPVKRLSSFEKPSASMLLSGLTWRKPPLRLTLPKPPLLLTLPKLLYFPVQTFVILTDIFHQSNLLFPVTFHGRA